ncbi:NUDIX hydrolase, partial [Glycomyces tenuis]|uniref:NUDIX hydrolase n=1 Tax=Glycomyces tenuis TaxID=58116 RepID=UPI003D15E24F
TPPRAQAGGDAAAAQWLPVNRALGEQLAFDHHRILSDAVEHARRGLEYTTAATAFCGKEFTISELRHVYEIVWQTKLDPGNFHRKVTRIDGFLEPTGKTTGRDGGRPAALYRAGVRHWLQLPLSQPELRLMRGLPPLRGFFEHRAGGLSCEVESR